MWLATLAWGLDTPTHVDAWREQVDWGAAEEEVTTWLKRYIEVDTVAPPGNERDGAVFLRSLLVSNGIDDVKLYEHGDNRASLVARLPGERSDGALCLLSHIDVVPSEMDKWTTEPLKGVVRDGYLYGRGALDMKGMAIMEAATMVQLARLEVPLDRGVVLLAVADEEVGGLGMQTMVDEYWDEVGCTHLINEGGLGLVDGLFEGQTLHAISVAEKGTLWFRMVAEGRAGHGSTIEEGEAPTRLLEAMDRLERKYRPRPRIDPAMYELFRRVGRHRGGVLRAILGSKLGVDLVVKPKLMKESTTAAALTDTLHLTGMGGASSVNVVPSAVWAQYDSRLLLGTDPDEQLERIQALVDDIEGIRFEVVDKTAANASTWEDPLFERIAHYAVEGRPEAVAAPVLSPGFTDSIFARPLGVRAYGYVPFEIDQDEALRMHGHDERVSLTNLREGTRRLFSIVTDFCARDTDVPRRQWARGGDGDARRARLEGAEDAVIRRMVEAENTSWLRTELAASEGPVSEDLLWHVLHADSDPALRAEVLERQSSGEMDADYARLMDRVLRDDGRPQRFGTVGTCEGGVFTPEPTEHADHVDTHRADVGLGPLSEACP